jgi:hypothetical protein
MNNRDKQKIQTAIKVYLRLSKLGDDTCESVIFQFADGTYCEIDLTDPIDQQVVYRPLGIKNPDLVMIHSKTNTLSILERSKNLPAIDANTVSQVHDLVQQLSLAKQ